MYEIMPKEVNEESAGILTDKEIDKIKNAGISEKEILGQ